MGAFAVICHQIPRGGKMGRVEPFDPRAVTGCGFGKQHHGLARVQPLRDPGIDSRNIPNPQPLYKNRVLQPRQRAKHRPACDFAFGQKTEWLKSTESQDISPRDMIGNNEPGCLR